MTIRRSARRDHFVVINQAIFDDERLDHRELGVLTYLLSKPDNWRTNSHQLSSRFHCNVTTIKGILSRLEELGYLLREKCRKPDGTFFWESIVFEAPTMGQKTSDEKTSDGKTSDGKTNDGKTNDGKTSDGKTSDGKLAHITNNEVTITELTKTDQQEEAGADAGIEDPFFLGQAKQIAREVAKQTKQPATKNFLTDSPWGELAQELDQDPKVVWEAFDQFMLAVHADKKDPEAYVGKVLSSLFQNPGTELANKHWVQFARYFRKNLSAPPVAKKVAPRQPQLVEIPDRIASAEAIRRARHG